jgi:hypothetical protein
MAERTRPTLRCVVEDLELPVPPIEVDLGDLDHILIKEARRVAPDSPKGQRRILAIKYPLVFRIRHAGLRGATWVDDQDVLWLLAVESRKEGSIDDAYEYFVGLHQKDRLLPDQQDTLRLRAEETAQLLIRLENEIISLCTEVTFNLESGNSFEIAQNLAGLLPVRIRALPGDIQEIWLAISRHDTNGAYFPNRLRDLLFAATERELQPEEWEWTNRFGQAELPGHEIGKLYLRT